MFGSNLFGTLSSDLSWISNNAILIFGVALLVIVIVILGVMAVK